MKSDIDAELGRVQERWRFSRAEEEKVLHPWAAVGVEQSGASGLMRDDPGATLDAAHLHGDALAWSGPPRRAEDDPHLHRHACSEFSEPLAVSVPLGGEREARPRDTYLDCDSYVASACRVHPPPRCAIDGEGIVVSSGRWVREETSQCRRAGLLLMLFGCGFGKERCRDCGQ